MRVKTSFVVIIAAFILSVGIAIFLIFWLHAPRPTKMSVILDFFANPNLVPV